MTFGDRLRELRNEKKLNQSDCAEIFELSSSAIGSYERNEREPAYSYLVKFADYYKVSIDYLLCRTDERLVTTDYAKMKTHELGELLDNYDISLHGYELTEEDKKLLSDVCVGLFWKKFKG